MSTREYVVVTAQIVGSLENWATAYYSDLKRHANREAAITHGWKQHGHDDWLIAILERDTLVMTAWMHDDRPDEVDELVAMANEFLWTPNPSGGVA